MKLSTKGRYGLRALIDLALYSDNEEAVSIQSISERQHISDSYLEQLMRKLKKEGLIQSVRGAQGGYRLAKPAEEISVGDVLRALEGSIEAVSCGEGSNEHCQGEDLCVARYVWQEINKSIQETVDSIMLSQLVEESRKVREKGQIKVQKCNQ
ncbi:MAG: Rrf2 family transcriptional regulator [Blautia sp.]|nr:Rrf2 family transcriptional regulator [Blautia sp.]